MSRCQMYTPGPLLFFPGAPTVFPGAPTVFPPEIWIFGVRAGPMPTNLILAYNYNFETRVLSKLCAHMCAHVMCTCDVYM